MGQSTEELRREIEGTRADMSMTLDAIGDRVSPGRIVQRRKNRVSYAVQNMRERVMGFAHDAEHALTDTAGSAVDTVKQSPQAMTSATQGSPLMAGAIALGAGFLVAAAFPPTDKERQLANKAMEKIEPAKEQLVEAAKESAEHLKQPAMDAAQQVKQEATTAASDVASTAKEAVAETKQDAQQAASNVRSQTGQGSSSMG